MTALDRRLPLLARMAWLCTALMLATIMLSAYLRLSQAGLGCADWPACYGQNLRELQQGAMAAPGDAVAVARLAHRIVASLTLVAVAMMAMLALASPAVKRRTGALLLALLTLALALAALGILTPGARLPAVAMGNLLGGFVMLALCARLVARAQHAQPVNGVGATGLGAWAVVALLLLCGQLAIGALVSTSYAALSCVELVDCARAVQASGWPWQALNPWREPLFAATIVPINVSGALALLAHRVGAVVVLPVLCLLGVAAWRRGRRRGGATLIALALVQGALGLLIVATGLPLAAVLLHNLVAALLLATLARLV